MQLGEAIVEDDEAIRDVWGRQGKGAEHGVSEQREWWRRRRRWRLKSGRV